jgi:hypothetical protein
LRLNRVLAALVIALGLLAGAAPSLACAAATNQTDCCPQDSLACADVAGSAVACCAAPFLLPGASSSAARAGLDLRPDIGSLPAAPIPAWALNPAPAADVGCLNRAGESPLSRHSQPVYLRTNRLRL